MKNTKTKKNLSKIAYYFFLCLFSVVFLFPIYCMLLQSVVPDSYFKGLPSLFPSGLNFRAYTQIFNDLKYLYYFKNTLIVCLSNVLGVCVAASFCSYGLAKVHFKGKTSCSRLFWRRCCCPAWLLLFRCISSIRESAGTRLFFRSPCLSGSAAAR